VWFPKGSALSGGRQKVANEMHSGVRVRIVTCREASSAILFAEHPATVNG